MEPNPHSSTRLQISDLRFSSDLKRLVQLVGDRRFNCPSCQSSRKFLCSKCRCIVVPRSLLQDASPPLIPEIEPLPLKIHVLRDPLEKESKSSCIPLHILAPHSISIYNYGDEASIKLLNGAIRTPDDSSSSTDSPLSTNTPNTVLLFPTEDSVSVGEIAWDRVSNLVVLDCTWPQTKKLLRLPVFQKLPKVRLDNIKTIFWRYQWNTGGLATAEAIYYLLREVDALRVAREQEKITPPGVVRPVKNFDDLLFFFALQYEIIDKSASARRPREWNDGVNLECSTWEGVDGIVDAVRQKRSRARLNNPPSRGNFSSQSQSLEQRKEVV